MYFCAIRYTFVDIHNFPTFHVILIISYLKIALLVLCYCFSSFFRMCFHTRPVEIMNWLHNSFFICDTIYRCITCLHTHKYSQQVEHWTHLFSVIIIILVLSIHFSRIPLILFQLPFSSNHVARKKIKRKSERQRKWLIQLNPPDFNVLFKVHRRRHVFLHTLLRYKYVCVVHDYHQ